MVYRESLKLQSRDRAVSFHDVTQQVKEIAAKSGMKNGIEWLGFWPLFHAANILSRFPEAVVLCSDQNQLAFDVLDLYHFFFRSAHEGKDFFARGCRSRRASVRIRPFFAARKKRFPSSCSSSRRGLDKVSSSNDGMMLLWLCFLLGQPPRSSVGIAASYTSYNFLKDRKTYDKGRNHHFVDYILFFY